MGLITELEAMNQILSVTGDAAVSSVTSTYEQAIIARRILSDTSREAQMIGYWFNELPEYELLFDATNGEVLLPNNCIRCDIDDNNSYIQRGSKLFDRDNNTYNIGVNVTVNMITELEWVELPQSFRQYVIAKAKKRYNMEYFGSQETDSIINQDLSNYFIELKREDVDNRQINMLNNSRSYNIAFRNRR